MEQELRETTPKKKNKTRVVILLAIVLIGGFFGIRAWLHAQHHETTDNAQLDATISSVRSAVTGFVKEVRFEDNQHVKKGDTLVIIDNKDYVAKVEQAKAMLQSAEAQTGVSRVASQAAAQTATASSMSTAALQANIDAANARLTRATKELDRVQNMYSQEAATQQQLDAIRAEYQSAVAQRELAVRQYQAAIAQSGSVKVNAQAQKQQVSVSNALVEQRRAELQLAESQLSNTYIIAPFDGVVSKKSIETGQLVQAGQPVCSAVESNELWVTANFKETQLNKMKIGQKVNVELDAYPSLKITGTVESIGAATGAKFSLLPPDNATGNFVKVTQRIPVRIRLDKINNNQYALAPGLSATVDVEIQ
jgi:membrane fusion protein (multidrug efflux system)